MRRQGGKNGSKETKEFTPTAAWTEEQLVKMMKAPAVGRKGKSVDRQKERQV